MILEILIDFSDRVRTAVNVVGDGLASAAVAHILKSRLEMADARHDYKTEIKEEIGKRGGGREVVL